MNIGRTINKIVSNSLKVFLKNLNFFKILSKKNKKLYFGVYLFIMAAIDKVRVLIVGDSGNLIKTTIFN